VLVTAAGSATALGLIEAALRLGAERVVAADIHPARLVAASCIAHAFEQVPGHADERFPGQLAEIIARHRVDTYVPVIDGEIALAAALRSRGALPGALAVLAPAAHSAALCTDKLACGAWLQGCKLPAPLTVPLAAAHGLQLPLFAKPRRSFGSRGARHITRPEDLGEIAAAGEEMVLQELLEPPEVTVDAFRDAGPALFRAVCRERIEVKAGVCTKARLFADPALEALARGVGEALCLEGTYCVQVMRHPGDGGWRITDVNARPGAGTAMSCAAGFDFLAATLLRAWGCGAAELLPPLAAERHVVRRFAEVVTA
jgi:carbamoylphosphate synthase large subunit